MNTSVERWDVIVVGAGTAGATAALHLAAARFRVLLLDARAFAESGARWVNAVPAWMFDEAGVERPTSRPELRARVERHVMIDPSWQHRVVLEGSPMLFVDMRHVVRRLHRAARDAGATLREQEPVRDVLIEGGRVVGVRTPRATLRARLVIDASGIAAVVRRRVPALRARCPAPRGSDVGSAAQEVRRIRDLSAARAWLEARGLIGDALGVVGLEGGFSTRLVQVDLEHREVEILTGAIAEAGRASGQELIDDFVRAHDWVGERLFGGAGAIPLRRPYDCLGLEGVALVGDAACQVFTAHGSGVGAGMIAARMIADEFSRGEQGAVSRYERAFHRSLGARLAAYDVFRRWSQRCSPDDVATLIASGLFSKEHFYAGLAQRMPSLDARAMMGLVRAASRAPGLAARLLPIVLEMQIVHAWVRAFSSKTALLGPWSKGAARLMRASHSSC
jgi:flavin-dependent dehydrogenase